MHSSSSKVRDSVGGWRGFARALCLTILFVTAAKVGLAGGAEYWSILETLAQWGPERAVPLLIETAPGTTGDSSAGWESKRRRQLEVAQDLLTVDAAALLPIIDLHDRAQLELHGRGNGAAADQERVTTYLISNLYAEQALTDRMRQQAGDIFAMLAGYFHESSPGPTAADLYRRALTFDFGNEAALSGLAHILESKGQYRRALPHLEVLFAMSPQREEARLRRAVNLMRAGRRSEASWGLQGLVLEARSEWIVAIAIQELARAALDVGDLQEAKRIVDQGLDRLAKESTLLVMSAYLDERLGEQSERGSLGLQLEDSAISRLTASRFRYSEWNSDLVQEARDRFRQAADLARPRLGKSLSRRSPSSTAR